jgi:hypothetical protein
LEDFAREIHLPSPAIVSPLNSGDKLLWRPKTPAEPVLLRAELSRQIHNRHAGKYATGDVGGWHSFYFRGPENSINLCACNLSEFARIGRTVDEGIWSYHLRKGDYAEWFQHVIKDDVLAQEAQAIRADATLGVGEARDRLINAIGCRYKI